MTNLKGMDVFNSLAYNNIKNACILARRKGRTIAPSMRCGSYGVCGIYLDAANDFVKLHKTDAICPFCAVLLAGRVPDDTSPDDIEVKLKSLVGWPVDDDWLCAFEAGYTGLSKPDDEGLTPWKLGKKLKKEITP